GARMHLDVNKVYFTPRLSFERTRIASLVKRGEVIGAWFAGVGPFPLVIFKKQPDVSIYAIELNPVAYEYLVENVRINKAQSVITPVFGDVREVAKTLPLCDRIIMPLPKGAETFLDVAFDRAKSGCVIHFYSFGSMEEPFEAVEEKIFEIAKACGRDVRIAGKRVVRPYSPSVVQVSFDVIAL
ncbi:tRNA (guanine-N1)-methyltransferase, partial [Candidatus Micrarchaeota archaeon]|nr:tRNA (guanine-N1)-methyltransferase [Candidatus Micrarchaeota archaeon]